MSLARRIVWLGWGPFGTRGGCARPLPMSAKKSASTVHWMGRRTISCVKSSVMAEARANAVQAAREEVAAGRLERSDRAVGQIIVPHPTRGRRLDVLPDDEGSASEHSGSYTDADLLDDDSDDSGEDCQAKTEASATAESTGKDVAPAIG